MLRLLRSVPGIQLSPEGARKGCERKHNAPQGQISLSVERREVLLAWAVFPSFLPCLWPCGHGVLAPLYPSSKPALLTLLFSV